MNIVNLTGKQKRHLRSLGNTLSPLVRLGKSGIDDGVVAALDAALTQHELVKVKINPEFPEGKKEAGELLSSKTHSAVAQVIGGTILLYRRHPKTPKIRLPKEGSDASDTDAKTTNHGPSASSATTADNGEADGDDDEVFDE